MHRSLLEIEARVKAAQAAYYTCCSESDPDSASAVRSSIVNLHQSKRTAQDLQQEYAEVVAAANVSQQQLRADIGDKLLSELELLEHQRMELTKVREDGLVRHCPVW